MDRFDVEGLSALEILDSRGRPTVKATCRLASGTTGSASVPSGASTGAAEALELRDGDSRRYRGLGCRQAVANVDGPLNQVIAGRSFATQAELDAVLLALDGTPNKARLGANAILAVSLAYARAAAAEQAVALYAYFAGLAGEPVHTLPRPMINLFSGGKHAGGQVPLQDLLIVPVSAQTMDETLAIAFAVYQSAAELVRETYGMRLLRADEGGLAPPFPDLTAMFEVTIGAIRRAGLEPGDDVCLAVDVAASHFYEDGRYHLIDGPRDSAGMIEQIGGWVQRYPIISVEDGLAENDWAHWPVLRSVLQGHALTLGDDLLCTNPQRIEQAITSRAADALLLKVNQVGTVTEALAACRLARNAGWAVTVSARSGETEDDWLADLAVGWSGDYIKIGSITQSERLAKYNRLLAIEAAPGFPLAGVRR